jgi:uracil-DNA glycosylase
MQPPIMVVNEYLNEAADREGKAIAGPEASVMFGLLAQAGIDRNDVYFTNVINQRPSGNRVESFCGTRSEGVANYRALFGAQYIRAEYQSELDRLNREIEINQPNVIIALGNLALWALCKKSGIKKYRGSPMMMHNEAAKVIPTWHPTSVQRQWSLRVVALSDIAKARRESEFPDLRRPIRYIHVEPTLADIAEFYETHILPSPFLACDIETKQRTITEVGYSTADGKHALVIPFYSRLATDGNYWPTLAQEKQAWKWVRRINAEKPLVGQNFTYDMSYFWRTMGIPCSNFLGDTMILHHSLQPELEKGLGFLGSIYTDEPSWKFMRTDSDNAKKGDE